MCVVFPWLFNIVSFVGEGEDETCQKGDGTIEEGLRKESANIGILYYYTSDCCW